MSRRRRVPLFVCLLLVLSGCRATGRLSDAAYSWGAATFAPNPISVLPFFGGLGIGFVAALPLCLISWPLSLILYPADEEEFFLSAALSPSVLLGSLTGTALAAPLYPLGLPFEPEEAD